MVVVFMIGSAVLTACLSVAVCRVAAKKDCSHDLIDYGMWIWGSLLLWMIVGIVVTIAVCEPLVFRNLDGETQFRSSRGGFDGIYIALSDLSGVVTAIVATMTGVWGYFFINRSNQKEKAKNKEVNLVLDSDFLSKLLATQRIERELEQTIEDMEDSEG